MKSFLLAFALLLFTGLYAQDYKKEWEKVMEYETDGKMKSAAGEVAKIYTKAKKDKNEAQVIKTFFFSSKYMQVLEEDAHVKIVNNLRSEIKTASPATRALLESIYGEILHDFYDRNSYKINQRTSIDSATSDNFLEWTGRDFEKAINLSYKNSIKNRELLYNTPLDKYRDIIEYNLMSPQNNRSLYDFLLERYLSLLQQYQNIWVSDKEQLKLLYANTNDFIKFKQDSLSKKVKESLQLYQSAETFYIAKKDDTSLYRAILRRLNYVSIANYRDYDTVNKIRINAFNNCINTWNDNSFVYHAKLNLAKSYNESANKESYPDYKANAIELCNDIIKNSQNNDVSPNALLLKNNITSRSISVTTEKFIIPNKPMLALIRFKNSTEVKIAIYKVIKPLQETKEYYKNAIKNKKPVFEDVYMLPSVQNYFEYTTEIIIPALPSGHYIIAASEKSDEEKMDVNAIHVTQIAFVKENRNFNTEYQVVNRETGAPVNNAEVTLEGKNLHIDNNGKATVKPVTPKTYNPKANPPQQEYSELTIQAVYESDTITSGFTNYFLDKNSYKNEGSDKAIIQLYLDRAIYRPGQTMYFKGIVTRRTKKKISAVPAVYVSIEIDGANNNELKTFRLKTNEFGSFTGEFTIPDNVLTGEFTITAGEDETPEKDPSYNNRKDEHPFWDNITLNDASVEFKVEEYKRPTFFVKFEHITQDFSLNEKATLTGIAKSYSGTPVSNAKVKYNIKRDVTTAKWNYSGYYPDIEIKTGEAVTDADGKFTVDFILEPEKQADKATLPVFNYTVKAEVTDINGETRNTTTEMNAGYHSLELKATIPDIIRPGSKENNITVNSENLNGHFLPISGKISIYKIAGPNQVYRERLWSMPEIQSIPEAEFIKNFPYISYNEPDSTIYSKKVFEKQLNTATVKSITLNDFTGWPSGKYELVFTATDKSGNLITEKKHFNFERNTDTYLADNKIFMYQILNKNFSKDGFVLVKLRTALPLLYVHIAADKIKDPFDEHIAIRGGQAILKIPIDKNPRNLPVNISYVWQNKIYTEQFTQYISEKIQELEINTTFINNKLQPGEKANWMFTIGGGKNLPAEVLAAMYDTSLDNFAKNPWYYETPDAWIRFSPDFGYREMSTAVADLKFHSYTNYAGYKIKNFEHQLNTYGFNINKSELNVSPFQITPVINTGTKGTFYISGVVSDETGPLPGANVIIKGTDQGVQTDLDGVFSIPVRINDVLEFTYLGYEPIEVNIGSDSNVDIVLDGSANGLAEVKIDRYRSTTSKTTTAAVTTIQYDAISIVQSLQGQVAGLNIEYGSGQPGADSTIILRGVGTTNGNVNPLFIVDGIPVDENGFRSINPDDIVSFNVLKDAAATSLYGEKGKDGVILIYTKQGKQEIDDMVNIKARKNFNETAFFYPQLTTDKKGNINVSFTTPESLTEWKLRLLAHNKKGVSGYFESLAVTQKDLMVVPNMPRFLREKDTIVITAKITNITPDAKTGNAVLQLFDALTMQPADAAMMNADNVKPFTLTAKGSTTVSWKIAVPQGMQAIQYKVLAKAGNFTDGEENILPVLTNNNLVTESLPLWVRENSTREYTFNNLKNNTSSTLHNHQVTLEYTSNPAWLAIQSLPYLMEYEHECAEQVFARYYANAIATDIVNSNPKIAEVFAAWREKGKTLSKLGENEELKSVIAAGAPWLQDVQSEEERKNRIALLFDLGKMKFSLDADLQKLTERQLPSGGFPWFDGGTENEFITRHVLAGLGHLKKAGIDNKNAAKTDAIIKKALPYTDARFIENYKTDEKNFAKRLTIAQPYSDLHYLYTRSFYVQQYPLDTLAKKAAIKYLDYTKNNWLKYTLYEKGLAALALHRFGEKEAAAKIITSLKETAANNSDSGMYWIENKPGWYWHQAPIETQALLIEAFSEITNDTKGVDEMKVWLLKQKLAKSWPTTKATTEAVYALLSKGTNWLSVKENTVIQLGNNKILAQKLSENEKEAGTGYMKLIWKPEEITKDMATLNIENKSAVPGYGGLYWQYFEDLDKIKPAQEGIMNISKELYLKKNTAAGPELKKISTGNMAKTGGLVTVRLVLNVTEDMEYVHLKDLRASAFEPVDVLSKYEWKDGLGFYRSTKDAATHYFFDKINKGTYILEYDVRVNNAGEFSGGISTLQSMYAPEFSGHSKGIRIKTE